MDTLDVKIYKGDKLLEKIKNGYFKFLFPNLVADTVVSSLERLESFFGTKPDLYGSNIELFQVIREEIFYELNNESAINSLMLVAPHTHWDGENPIVYSYDEECKKYFIGHQKIKPENYYLPVSFVFYKSNAHPYEWLSTNKIGGLEQEIIELSQKISNSNFFKSSPSVPIGLCINFRFKESLNVIGERTVETPSDDPKLAVIETYSEYIEKNESDYHTEQVAWTAICDLSYDLKADELNLLREMRKKLF